MLFSPHLLPFYTSPNGVDTMYMYMLYTVEDHIFTAAVRFGRADHFNPDTKPDETKTVERLEATVVEFFHRDFLTLLGQLK